ncbi:hypothetical protein [Seonamhaeicola sp. ML3]|uniref:hypothetical protein n=1 Tax=Seonamhaeicola sp. ML3 TaxID=2937786 RepID=UPI00200ECAD3|nr:hypothetical protein [Seonamhaeicola sp. ML3]
MKNITLLLLITLVFSCNKKVVELPEISHSDITEIKDVSAAYLFYDETQTDSVELNRKNLISTTNWLVNVDKRLTLKQVIPHIKFLQEKKANGAHKNESAKNYFTCHDTNRNNLGFVEFTDVNYIMDGAGHALEPDEDLTNMLIFENKEISIITLENRIYQTNINSLLSTLKDSLDSNSKERQIFMSIHGNLKFQDYIVLKSIMKNIKNERIKVSNYEFIGD